MPTAEVQRKNQHRRVAAWHRGTLHAECYTTSYDSGNAALRHAPPGDAMHSSRQRDGRHSGGTDLDGYGRQVRQDGVRDVADEADRGRADQQAPENRTARRWFVRGRQHPIIDYVSLLAGEKLGDLPE